MYTDLADASNTSAAGRTNMGVWRDAFDSVYCVYFTNIYYLALVWEYDVR